MGQEKFITNTILITASADAVWDALVNPEKTKVYMFGCETVSDWKIGSPLLWKGAYEGKETVFVKGTILEMAAPTRLVYTVFDPNSTMEDRPENYLTVTYMLQSENNRTQLTVQQGDYNKVGDGERRYMESYNNGEGWNPILEQIKKIVE